MARNNRVSICKRSDGRSGRLATVEQAVLELRRNEAMLERRFAYTFDKLGSERRQSLDVRRSYRKWYKSLFRLEAFRRSLAGLETFTEVNEWFTFLLLCQSNIETKYDPIAAAKAEQPESDVKRAIEKISEAQELLRQPYASWLQNIVDEIRIASPSPLKHDYLRHYLDPALIGRRGGASTNREGALRGALVRGLNAKLSPEIIDRRYATIADLLTHCGLKTSAVQVRSIILRGST